MTTPRRFAHRPLRALPIILAAILPACSVSSPDPMLSPAMTAPPRPPTVARIAVPEIPGSNAIFGAVGRDSRGHLWLGVSSKGVEAPSAHLFEYDPAADVMTDCGDVVTALKDCGVYRPGDQQMKIHSRIVQAADGNIYFASMDEAGESVRRERPPTHGGHLWRFRLPQRKWEHLLRAPEALICAAEAGRHVYALGYWGHMLYQYDTRTGKTRSLKVGSMTGHISRNVLTDRKGHVYVPRVKPGGEPGSAVATLVEFDPELREVAELPLEHYLDRDPEDSQGITGFANLPDGRIAFITQYGHVALLEPSDNGPARIKNLGWFHPKGGSYTHSLFTDRTGRYLIGTAKQGRNYEWIVYDIEAQTPQAFPFKVGLTDPQDERGPLYGTGVRDNAGNCYVVTGEHGEALVLQIRP